MTAWWFTAYNIAIALLLALAGYAWHDRLRGRYPWAAPAAAATIMAGAILGAALRYEETNFVALALLVCPALGWFLRKPDAATTQAPVERDAGLGAAYGALAALAGVFWSPTLRNWGFVVLLALLAVRLAVIDPYLRWRERRRSAAEGESP